MTKIYNKKKISFYSCVLFMSLNGFLIRLKSVLCFVVFGGLQMKFELWSCDQCLKLNQKFNFRSILDEFFGFLMGSRSVKVEGEYKNEKISLTRDLKKIIG